MVKTVLEQVRGVGPVTAKKLIEAGIQSVEQLATESVGTLADISGFPVSRVTEILQSATEIVGIPESQPDEIKGKTDSEKPTKKKKKKKKDKKKKGNKDKKAKDKKKSGKKKKKGKKKK